MATSLPSPGLPGRQKESAPPAPPSLWLLRDPQGTPGACRIGVQEVLEPRSFITDFHFYQAGILHREWKNNSQVPGIPQAPAAGKMIIHFHCTHFGSFQFSWANIYLVIPFCQDWIAVTPTFKEFQMQWEMGDGHSQRHRSPDPWDDVFRFQNFSNTRKVMSCLCCTLNNISDGAWGWTPHSESNAYLHSDSHIL